LRTWFRKEEEFLEPESITPADAARSSGAAAHRNLDARLKRTLESLPAAREDRTAAFLARLEKGLADADRKLTASEKFQDLMLRISDFLRADSFSAVRYASLIMVPVFTLIIYAAMEKSLRPEMTASASVNDEMAPDVESTYAGKSDAPPRELATRQMASGYPTESAPRARAMDEEFDRVNQETLTIQEDLLKKNLEIASNAAARKSALEQLLDFYKKGGMKEKARDTEAQLQKVSAENH